MNNNEVEIWRDIPEYEGKYMISNFGRVKSLKDKYGNHREMIRKPCKNNKGYLLVNLYKNGKNKWHTIHRLVLLAFIGKPLSEIYSEVNHKDEDKTNNSLYNLEYCTTDYNHKYGTRIKKLSKPVIGINKTNDYICEFSSAKEAERVTGIQATNIRACCKGKRRSAGSYIWMYKEDYEENKIGGK